jgi:hypothetical protein
MNICSWLLSIVMMGLGGAGIALVLIINQRLVKRLTGSSWRRSVTGRSTRSSISGLRGACQIPTTMLMSPQFRNRAHPSLRRLRGACIGKLLDIYQINNRIIVSPKTATPPRSPRTRLHDHVSQMSVSDHYPDNPQKTSPRETIKFALEGITAGQSFALDFWASKPCRRKRKWWALSTEKSNCTNIDKPN